MIPLSAYFLLGSLAPVAHSYVGYPLWWTIFGNYFSRKAFSNPDFQDLPSVTIIVAAYNEDTCIANRIRNLLALDYPHEKLQIFIESDGSDDSTVTEARKAAQGDQRVHISDHKERRGKVSVLNDACRRAGTEILAFSDANVDFAPDALLRLISPFFSSEVACVCGKLRFRVPEGSAHAASEGIYWKLESWLKEQEGSRGVLLGANGAIYALRRSLWKPCPPDTVVEDFYIPMTLLMNGHEVVFEPTALAYEDLPPTLKDEFGRRIRIGAGDFQALVRCLPLLHPRHGLAAWAFFSRKVLRWLGPFFLLFSFLSTLVLVSSPNGYSLGYLSLFCWALFISMAFVGTFATTRHGFMGKIFGASAHFASMNLALLFGFFRWLSRSQRVTWKRTAR